MSHNISMNQFGICINGTYRTLLVSSFFYFRIPRIRWKKRLLLLKAAGYHAIDVYFPWNYHETAPGQWEFSGNRDVTAFLQLAAECGMYVIARPGPYICSEWDGGAIPAWLYVNQIKIRQDDPDFLSQLDNWYAHILPLIAPFQITNGDSSKNQAVLCMQIENELDFFDCKSPVSYMQKLMEKSKLYGINVPLFYCCGQNDLLRAGGLTPSLYTAFNVYADADCESLEERALHLYASVRERDMPFMVSETNREHSFLKRLLVCGAKLLSPYNQTAGSTTEWYNGITNWGSADAPLSLLSSDYDFDSMIGSAGEVNEEFYEARLLSGLLYSMGEAFACAVPVTEETALHIDSSQPHNTHLPVLRTSAGSFVAVSNLGDSCDMTLTGTELSLQLSMPAGGTRLLPLSLLLSRELDITLCCCSYELCGFWEEEGKLILSLYGTGPLNAVLSIGGEKKQIHLLPEEETGTYFLSPVMIRYGTKKAMAMSSLPGLPDIKRELSSQKETFVIDTINSSPYTLTGDDRRQTPILPLEHLSQYRGIGSYRFLLPESCQVLFEKTADILTLNSNGTQLEAFYGRGQSVERQLPKGIYEITAQIWGHSNFHDVRCRSLLMNSLKGLHGITVIKNRLDLSDNWFFDLDESPAGEWYFFRHSPFNTVMSVDSYNRAATPLHTVYDRWVDVPDGCDSLFLHFAKADCIINVYVNNHLVETVFQDDPYVNISDYADCKRIELTLRIQRRYFSDSAGSVTLLAGTILSSCEYCSLDVEGAAMPSGAAPLSLPAQLSPSATTLCSLTLPEHKAGDIKLFFKGQDLLITVLSKGAVVGRLVLPNNTLPVVKGGRPDVVFLCSEWLSKEPLLLLCQPIGRDPFLSSIEGCFYHSVCEDS